MRSSIFVALALFLFTGSAVAVTKGEFMKCTGRLHACLKQDFDTVVQAGFEACTNACFNSVDYAVGNDCADINACTSRCAVAFEQPDAFSCD